MQRNHDLIRRILEHVEKYDQQGLDNPDPQFPGIEYGITKYHIQLCRATGFIRGIDPRTGTDEIIITGLTPTGHDELARLRRSKRFR